MKFDIGAGRFHYFRRHIAAVVDQFVHGPVQRRSANDHGARTASAFPRRYPLAVTLYYVDSVQVDAEAGGDHLAKTGFVALSGGLRPYQHRHAPVSLKPDVRIFTAECGADLRVIAQADSAKLARASGAPIFETGPVCPRECRVQESLILSGVVHPSGKGFVWKLLWRNEVSASNVVPA